VNALLIGVRDMLRKRFLKLSTYCLILLMATSGVLLNFHHVAVMATNGIKPFDPEDKTAFISYAPIIGFATQLTTVEHHQDGSIQYTQIGDRSANIIYNALAYNTNDNFLYAIVERVTGIVTNPRGLRAGDLIRIGQDAQIEYVATLQGNASGQGNAPATANTAVYDPDNHIYYAWGYNSLGSNAYTDIFNIDLANGRVISRAPFDLNYPVSDFTFANGYMWALRVDNSRGVQLVQVNPATGKVTLQPIPDLTLAIADRQIGAAWTIGEQNNSLIFSSRYTRNIIRVDINSENQVVQFARYSGSLIGATDGAAMLNIPAPGLPNIKHPEDPDLAATKHVTVVDSQDDDQVAPGEWLTYEIVVENAGNGMARDVAIVDTFADTNDLDLTTISNLQASDGENPVAMTGDNILSGVLVDIPAGQTVTVRFDIQVKSEATAAEIVNTATVTEADGSVQRPTVSIPIHKLEVTNIVASKSSIPEPSILLAPNQLISYQITVTNDSTVPAHDVKIEDQIPEFTTYIENSASDDGVLVDNTLQWKIPVVEPGETKSVTFQVRVEEHSELTKYTIENSALVNGEWTNEVRHDIEQLPIVVGKPNIVAHKSSTPVSGTLVGTDQEVTYQIAVTNNGTAAAYNVKVEDQIPKFTTYIRNSASDNGALRNNTLQWEIPVVEPGETKLVTFQVRVEEHSTLTKYAIENSALVNGEWTNEVRHDVERLPVVVGKPNIVANKSSTPVSGTLVGPDQEVTYQIAVTNNGTTAAYNVKVEDQIPKFTTYVKNSASNNGALRNNTLQWTIPVVEPGETRLVTFTVKVDKHPKRTHYTLSNVALVNGKRTNKVSHPAEQFIKKAEYPITQSGETAYSFKGIGNPTGRSVLNYTIQDIPPENIVFTKAQVPAFYKGKGLDYNVIYKTNRTEGQWKVLHDQVPADQSFEFSTPVLQTGERITNLAIQFKEVPANFAKDNEMLFYFKSIADSPNKNIGMISYSNIDSKDALTRIGSQSDNQSLQNRDSSHNNADGNSSGSNDFNSSSADNNGFGSNNSEDEGNGDNNTLSEAKPTSDQPLLPSTDGGQAGVWALYALLTSMLLLLGLCYKKPKVHK